MEGIHALHAREQSRAGLAFGPADRFQRELALEHGHAKQPRHQRLVIQPEQREDLEYVQSGAQARRGPGASLCRVEGKHALDRSLQPLVFTTQAQRGDGLKHPRRRIRQTLRERVGFADPDHLRRAAQAAPNTPVER